MQNETHNKPTNGSKVFILLAFILLGFMATTWLLGYLWALIFAALVGGYVLWSSLRGNKSAE